MKQTNVPQPEKGIAFKSAVGGTFVVRVTGEAGNVILRALSEEADQPITGKLTLGLVGRPADPAVTVAEVEGSTLDRKVAPGTYRGTFEIPGLVSKSTDFTVAANETKTVDLKVSTIYFPVASVIPQPSADDVKSAKFVASVKNNTGELPGPVTLEASVFHDGAMVDTVAVREFASLPPGLTDADTTYVPANGWRPGTYSFEYQLKAPAFTVEAPVTRTITIPGSKLPLAIGTVAGLIVAAAVFLLVWRRRKRRDER